MNAAAMKLYKYLSGIALPIICFIMLIVSALPGQAVAATANGIIRQVGTQQVLNLWGTNYEMGYAHGYLLADKIRDMVDHYMINTVAGSVSVYNGLLVRDASEFQWQQQYLDEIRGMAEGMAASGRSLYVASLGRNIDARDIRALNLQEQFYFGCSSFGLWRNATADGETLLARNLDFYYDPQGNNANYQLIIAYEPTGKTRFVSFAWPGAVGVYSGMNENGVTVLANTGNLSNPYSGPFHPIAEVYRYILERTTADNYLTEPLAVIKSFHESPSEIIQIGTSYLGSGYPVYYIEQSPDQDLIRYPADNGYDHIIAANHFMSVIPPPSAGESLTRYNTLRNGLISLYGSGDRKVDSTEAWGLLRSVANVIAPTLTSIVIRPNRLEFDLAFARMANGVFTSAVDVAPQTFGWASLFPDHGLVAVDDAFSTTVNTVLNQAAPGILGNDTGAEGAILVSGPARGSLTLNSDGAFTYTPPADYAGSDSFTYMATRGTSSSNVATVTINILPAATLSSLSLSPASVTGGTASSGTVVLTAPAPAGGAVVTLSDNSSAAAVPASVTIAAGNTSAGFTIATSAVASSTAVTVSAQFAGVTKTAVLTVSRPALSSLTITPASVTGGTSAQGTVRLTGPAPVGGVVVTLSDNSSAAAVPASVTVAAGNTTAGFTIATSAVAGSTAVTVSAQFAGVTKTALLTVSRPALSSLAISPASVIGGTSSQGTVKLTGPAPAGGVVVTLSDNSSAVSVPASITIAAGSTSAVFTITTYPVYSSRAVTISASYGGVVKSASLTVRRRY